MTYGRGKRRNSRSPERPLKKGNAREFTGKASDSIMPQARVIDQCYRRRSDHCGLSRRGVLHRSISRRDATSDRAAVGPNRTVMMCIQR